MNPSVDDRLNSVLRALQTVVLPALPESASLAREQVMLAMGHIQIVQAQRDATPGYEAGELADLRAMAAAVLALDHVPAACAAARAAVGEAMADDTAPPRIASEAIRTAIDALLTTARAGGCLGLLRRTVRHDPAARPRPRAQGPRMVCDHGLRYRTQRRLRRGAARNAL